MADPYWRYSYPPPERGSTPKPRLPGHISAEVSTVTTYHQRSSNDTLISGDLLQKDFLPSHPGVYGIDGIRGFQPEPSAGSGLTIGIRHIDYPAPFRDPSSIGQRRDVPPGNIPNIEERIYEKPNSSRRADAVGGGESNILFVDGLPTDCTRREVGHLFRPFLGFRDLKVVHKEPRHSGDKAIVLCFVEFTDTRCAVTAMKALQGYKFDDRKPGSPVLKIYFAHFPFRLPSHRDDQPLGSV